MAEKVVNADLTLTRPLKARSGGLGADASAAEWAIGTVPIKNASGGFSPRHFQELTNQFLYGNHRGSRSYSWTAISAPPTGDNNFGVSVSLGTVGPEQTSSPAISFWGHIDPLSQQAGFHPPFEIIAVGARTRNASQSTLAIKAYGAAVFTLPAVTGSSSPGAYLNTYLDTRALTLRSMPFSSAPPTNAVLPSNPNDAGRAFYVQANSNITIAGIERGKTTGQIFILATQSASYSPQTQPVKLLHNSSTAQQSARLLLPNGEDMDMPPFGAAVFMFLGSTWQMIAKNW